MTPEQHLAAALNQLGLSDDPELARTPALVAGLLREFQPAPPPPLVPLPTDSRDLLVMRALPFHSLCAHHLLPFFGTVRLVVRPAGRIAGLGWYARVVSAFARRPQLQERLCAQIADHVLEELGAEAVGVRVTARQMCVEMRGAQVSAEYDLVARRGGPDAGLDAALHG